jgi:uncharacterized protein YajQ (UPF0234 family)
LLTCCAQALREEMKTVAEEARGREALCRQLENDLTKLPKDANRDSYTQRTMEIVRNISRQKDDIAKVCMCVRECVSDCVCVCACECECACACECE